MPINFLHDHSEFEELIRIVGDLRKIDPFLVEKDYWIMHCLYGLTKLGWQFYLKGGTSLSKGYHIIERFSEDIDIKIDPPDNQSLPTGKNQNKELHRKARKAYYDWLAKNISIPGLTGVGRDLLYDDEKYRNGGIRLYYPTKLNPNKDLKEGILLEVGFDTVVPNKPMTISSWAYDYAKDKVEMIDNRAPDIPCYHPGYTLVEKLQTISTKFRKQQVSGNFSENFMRHYYDVYCLLGNEEVLNFIGTPEYQKHKAERFRSEDNPSIIDNQAFLLGDKAIFSLYEKQYQKRPSMYYKGRPSLSEIIKRIREKAEIL